MCVINKLKNIISKLLNSGGTVSYSQSGEDMILATTFCNIKEGFYVDVGANNPFEQSNTMHFYRKGWHGINIDPIPDSMKIFRKKRKRDINLEIAISDKEEVLNYYIYSSSFYNSFVKKDISSSKKLKLLGIRKIKTYKLSDILDKYYVGIIDFLSVDVEGFDLNVLKSNDWLRYRPKIVLTEYYAKDLINIENSSIYKLLSENGYILYCNTPTNILFIEKNYLQDRFK